MLPSNLASPSPSQALAHQPSTLPRNKRKKTPFQSILIPNTKMPLLLLDFDGTITQHDTLHPLVTLAISSSSPTSSSLPTPSTSSTISTPNTTSNHNSTPTTAHSHDHDDNHERLNALWEKIVRDYVADHAAHLDSYSPRPDERTTLEQELAFLESLGEVERKSVERVSGAGFFRRLLESGVGGVGSGGGKEGLDGRLTGAGVGGVGGEKEAEEGIRERKGEGESPLQWLGREAVKTKKVEVRKGFGEFMKDIKGREEQGWEVAVVSVNWSGGFIRGVVGEGCGEVITKEKVVANAIGSPEGRVEGPVELGGAVLVTAGDKLRGMKSLKKDKERVVYFGDSTTDLACLVEADLGIVIADDGESKVLKTLRRVGLEVPHVGDCDSGSKLVWARDFGEVIQSKVMDGI